MHVISSSGVISRRTCSAVRPVISRMCCESCQGEVYPVFAATSLIDLPGSRKYAYARTSLADTTNALAE
jgi:hypothetical protein